ncbi:MAG TPA: T9SS type A sorting domain-containing protein, partial [Bacteroidota bacterium]|nr:T9SS type A sorting domain-containing protein [Bacteroidota bacterium]
EAGNLPSWVRISPNFVNFDQLKPNEEQLALFTFSLDKSAPVQSEQTLTFVIGNSQGEQWTKEIRISVNPPESFELFQNFPNPFNPATTISYQLSAYSKILLRIYDLLGREVATLVDEEKAAGYHREWFDASRFSSGMYVYQLFYTDSHGNPQFLRKTMLLVK